jgi:membrane-associated protease RseP (regulator of RpoE activity)
MFDPSDSPAMDASGELLWVREVLDGHFLVEGVTLGARDGKAIRVEGQLLTDPDVAYEALAPRIAARDRTLLMRRENGNVVLYIARGRVKQEEGNRWLPWVLALATLLSVIFVGTVFNSGVAIVDLESGLRALALGLAYAAALLSIIGTHEMGHYLMAKRLGLPTSLPYLIPLPIWPFGTLGAVIRSKDLPSSRRAELLTGAAGPLAGLAVAIPVLILGLLLSEVQPLPTGEGYVAEGNSLLYLGLKYLVFGRVLPGGGVDVLLHPVAFAGWAGLLVTSLNLMPAGQLDGGHVAHALLGDKARYLTWGVIGALVLMGFLYPGWYLWAGLVFFFGRFQPTPYNDVSKLSDKGVALAIAMLVIFVLVFIPVPMRVV